MILKCVGGPMDGAAYALSRQTDDPGQRSTTRKPDGLWFNGTDEHGREVHHEYKDGGIMPLLECKEPVVMRYDYDGQVVITTTDYCTEENPRGDVTSGNRPTLPDQVPDAIKPWPKGYVGDVAPVDRPMNPPTQEQIQAMEVKSNE